MSKTIVARRKAYYRVTSSGRQVWFGSFFEAMKQYKQWDKDEGVAKLFKEVMLDYQKYVTHFKTILLYQTRKNCD